MIFFNPLEHTRNMKLVLILLIASVDEPFTVYKYKTTDINNCIMKITESAAKYIRYIINQKIIPSLLERESWYGNNIFSYSDGTVGIAGETEILNINTDIDTYKRILAELNFRLGDADESDI